MTERIPSQEIGAVRRHRLPSVRTALAVAIAMAMVGGGPLLAQSVVQSESAGVPSAAVVQPVMPSFADVAARVAPAVVNVTVSSDRTPEVVMRGHPDLPQGTPFDDFLHRFFDQEQSGMRGHPRVQGAGSGFIVDSEGDIVTNNHVVDGADEIDVTLNDGTKLKAKVVGRDPKTDLALIKVDAGHPLPHVELGDSTATRVGDWVLAVGNPFGLGGTVSAGIVSARGRDINEGPYDDFIQIDAPINRGNSGGPLFDAYGRVIGVNTAIYSPTGGSVGIGFAIPAETVRTVMTALKEHGHVDRGWLGVQIQPVTDELASGLGLKSDNGVLVADILPDGPAASSDLKAGDVILKAGGHEIRDYKELPKIVAATQAGTEMSLDIVRGGEPMTVTVKVGHMPADDSLAQSGPEPSAGDSSPGHLGLYLSPLTPEVRQGHGIDQGTQGVLVSRVEPDSPADRAGIEAGTVISMVGGEHVSNPRQAIEAVRKAAQEKRGAVVLRVEKGGKPMFVAVPFSG